MDMTRWIAQIALVFNPTRPYVDAQLSLGPYHREKYGINVTEIYPQ